MHASIGLTRVSTATAWASLLRSPETLRRAPDDGALGCGRRTLLGGDATNGGGGVMHAPAVYTTRTQDFVGVGGRRCCDLAKPDAALLPVGAGELVRLRFISQHGSRSN